MLAGLAAALAGRKAAVDAAPGGVVAESVGAGSPRGGGFGGGPPRQRAAGQPAGLDNQGATCYLNSLLQVLLNLGGLRDALLSHERAPTDAAPARSVASQLQALAARLTLGAAALASTRDLTRAFGWDASDAYVQNDVHECLTVLLEALEREAGAGTPLAAAVAGLAGSLVHYVRCEGCGGESTRAERFTSLQVPVRGAPTLPAALGAALAEEVLAGDNAYACATCGTKTTARKGARLDALPRVLFLHLARFEYDPVVGGRRKLADRMPPALSLDLSTHATDAAAGGDDTSTRGGDDTMAYELFGALLHLGSAATGHYLCYVRGAPAAAGDGDDAGAAASELGGGLANEPRWVAFNDATVFDIPRDALHRALGQLPPPPALALSTAAASASSASLCTTTPAASPSSSASSTTATSLSSSSLSREVSGGDAPSAAAATTAAVATPPPPPPPPASPAPSPLASPAPAATTTPLHDAATAAYMLVYVRRCDLPAHLAPPDPARVPADVRAAVEVENERVRAAVARWAAEQRRVRFRVVAHGFQPTALLPPLPSNAGAAAAAAAAAARRPPRPPGPPPPPSAASPTSFSPLPSSSGSPSPTSPARPVEVSVDRDAPAGELLRACVAALAGSDALAVAAAAGSSDDGVGRPQQLAHLWRLRLQDERTGQPAQPLVGGSGGSGGGSGGGGGGGAGAGGDDDAVGRVLRLPVAQLASAFYSPAGAASPVFAATSPTPSLRPRVLVLERRPDESVPWEEWAGAPLRVPVVVVRPRVAARGTAEGATAAATAAASAHDAATASSSPLDGLHFEPLALVALLPHEATVGGLRRAVAAHVALAAGSLLQLVVLPTSGSAHEPARVLTDDSAPLFAATFSGGGGCAALPAGATVHAEVVAEHEVIPHAEVVVTPPPLPEEVGLLAPGGGRRTLPHGVDADAGGSGAVRGHAPPPPSLSPSLSPLLAAWQAHLHSITLRVVLTSMPGATGQPPPVPQPPVSLIIDVRATIGELRRRLARALDRPAPFQLCRRPPATHGDALVPVGELRDGDATLTGCQLADGDELHVLPGEPTPPAHVLVRLTLWRDAPAPARVSDGESAAAAAAAVAASMAAQLQPLGTLQLASSARVSELKHAALAAWGARLPPPLGGGACTAAHLRVREAPARGAGMSAVGSAGERGMRVAPSVAAAAGAASPTVGTAAPTTTTPAPAPVRLGRLVPDDTHLAPRLHDGQQELVLCVLPHPEPPTAEGDGFVSVYRWRPVSAALDGPVELLLRASSDGEEAAVVAAAAAACSLGDGGEHGDGGGSGGGSSSRGSRGDAAWGRVADAAGLPAAESALVCRPWSWQLATDFQATLWAARWAPLPPPAVAAPAARPLRPGDVVVAVAAAEFACPHAPGRPADLPPGGGGGSGGKPGGAAPTAAHRREEAFRIYSPEEQLAREAARSELAS